MTPEAQRWLLPDRKPRRAAATGRATASISPTSVSGFSGCGSELASLKAELKFRQFFRSLKAGYRPDQPRVPAGNPDGGRWTGEGGGGRTQLAASGRPPVGPAAALVLALELALKVIDAYRSENGLWDLFGRRLGTVASTTIDGKTILARIRNRQVTPMRIFVRRRHCGRSCRKVPRSVYRARTSARATLTPCFTRRQRSCCAQHASTAVPSLVAKSRCSSIGRCVEVAIGCYR